MDEAKAGQLDLLAVSEPPRHGKSELLCKYTPAWYLGKYPDENVMLVGYGERFSGIWGGQVRNILGQWGPALFGLRVSADSSAADDWRVEGHDGGMLSASVRGGVTGRGASLLIIDDPIKNDEEVRSPAYRDSLWRLWDSTLKTRRTPNALTILIQTRWHRDDLMGRMLREAESNGQRCRSVRLPAVAEENDPLGRQPGEALWPEMWPVDKLQAIRKSTSSYYWNAIYQQRPIAEGTAEWPESYFDSGVWFEEWPRRWQCRVSACDPSKGKDAKVSDYSALVDVMVGDDGVLYVDADLERRNVGLIVSALREHARVFNPDGIAIETNGFQQCLADEVQRQNQEAAGVLLPVHEIENYGIAGAPVPDSPADGLPVAASKSGSSTARAGRGYLSSSSATFPTPITTMVRTP